MQAVIDTNVFVSALLGSGGGASRTVLRACLMGQIQPLISTALFLEWEEVLARPRVERLCRLSPTEVEELLDGLLSRCEWVRIYYRWRPSLPDSDDHHVLELAVAGAADAIITKNVQDFRGGELNFPEIALRTPESVAEEIRTWEP